LAKISGGGDLRQYEIFDNPSERTQSIAPYVVVLQSHLLEGLPSAIGAPLLVPDHAERFAYLSVDVEFRGVAFVLSLYEIATFGERQLRRPLGDLLAYHDEIARGLQRLLNGF
jgi:hypothetical protein